MTIPLRTDSRPHVPNTWTDGPRVETQDGQVGIVGDEIPFNRHFYQDVPPKPLEEIDKDLDQISREIMGLLAEVRG